MMVLDSPRQRLLHLLEEQRTTLAEASRAVGRNHAYLHQYVNRGSPKRLPEDVRLSLARLLRVDDAELKTGQPRISGNGEFALVTIPIVGTVEAGVWRERVERPPDEWEYVSAPLDKRYPSIPRFGLEIRDRSMDAIYPRGTILLCVLASDIDRPPRAGERVVCHCRDRDGRTEVTVREYRLDDAGQAWLWPRSADPALISTAATHARRCRPGPPRGNPCPRHRQLPLRVDR